MADGGHYHTDIEQFKNIFGNVIIDDDAFSQ